MQKRVSRFLLPTLVLGQLLFTGCASKPSEETKAPETDHAQLVEIGNEKAVKLSSESIRLAGITSSVVGKNRLSAEMQPTGEITSTDMGTVQVTSRLPGKVVQVFVTAGDQVKVGQTLALIDSIDLNQALATYSTAVSHLGLSKSQLDQQRKLAGFGSLSEQPVEDAKKSLSAAKAAVSSDEAQIKVDKLALRSTERLIAMGEITRKPVEDATNAYSQARAASVQSGISLHSAKSNLDRTRILYNGDAYSRQQYEDAETAFNTASAGLEQSTTAEKLAKQELDRQKSIYSQNLNGSGALQGAQSKLQQDQHTYESDLISESLAHKQLERATIVRRSGIPVSQSIQQAQDTYDEALVAVQTASNTLKLYGVQPSSGAKTLANGRTLIPITAPITGIVATKSMVVGQMTDTSTPLLKLINLDKVYVDSQVYEKDIQGVSVGDSIKVTVAAFPQKTFLGVVKMVGNEASLDTRTFVVRTIIPNPGWILRPGMFANVFIGSHRTVTTIAVPTDAIMQEGGRQVVYIERATGEFLKKSVVVGSPVAGKVPIESGISDGDKVVVSGNVYLQKEQEKLEEGRAKAK